MYVLGFFTKFLLILYWFVQDGTSLVRCKKTPTYSCESNNLFPLDSRISIEYANTTITKLKYGNNYVDFTVSFWGNKIPVRIIPCGCDVDSGNRELIPTNPTNIFVQDGPALFMFTEIFNEEDEFPVKYVSNIDYIFSKRIHDLFNSTPPEIISTELKKSIFEEQDDLGMAIISSDEFNYENSKTLFKSELGRPILPFAELNEINPLARAEWIKIIGLLYNRTSQANLKFAKIVDDYNDVKNEALKALRRPSVFFNYPQIPFNKNGNQGLDGLVWNQPGFDQYITAFIKDANADYRYYFRGEPNIENVLSFAEAENEFTSARILINSDPFPYRNHTIHDFIKDADSVHEKFVPIMKRFHSIMCGNVWGRRNRSSSTAIDFFESGAVRPDLVLKDYVTIFHPDVNLENHTIYYMKQYREPEKANLSCPYVSLLGDPGPGELFVEKDIIIVGLNRFQVQDQLIDNVYPELKRNGIEYNQVDVQFRTEFKEAEQSVEVTVRILVNEGNARAMKSSENITKSFKGGLQERGETISITEVESRILDEQKSFPAGAIVAIPIGIVVFILVIIFFILFRKARKITSEEVPTNDSEE